MILASIHNIFDGEELLPYSVGSIQDNVDIKIGVVQNISNTGKSYTPQFDEDLFDVIVTYHPTISRSPSWNEGQKRNMGIQLAKKLGATHFIGMDCDEVYVPEEFKKWKEYLSIHKYDVSLCKMHTYYRKPTLLISPPEKYWVVFICKLQKHTQQDNRIHYKYLCDPTRKVWPASRILGIDKQLMHHYSFIRKDIKRKFENSSSDFYRNNAAQLTNSFNSGELIHFKGHELVECENHFGIPLY